MATTGIAIGTNASATAVTGIAIGDGATAGANVVQLGPNTTATQLKVGSVQVVDSSGKIPVANLDGLATVATTGSYADLSNKPSIPTIPTTTTLVKGNGAGGLSSATAGTDYVATETDPVWTRDKTTATTVNAFQKATKMTLGSVATMIQIGPENGSSGTKRDGTTSVGYYSKAVGLRSSALGAWSATGLYASGAVAIGGVQADADHVTFAKADAARSIQLGPGTNGTADSLQFQSTPVVVGGKIVSANLDVPPTTADPTGSTSDASVPTSKAVATALSGKADGRQTQWVACGTSELGALTFVRRTGNFVEMKCNAPNDANGYVCTNSWNPNVLIPEGFRPHIIHENVPIRIYLSNGGTSGWGVGVVYNTGRWRPVEMCVQGTTTMRGTNNPDKIYRVLNFYHTWITDEDFPS